MTSQAPYLYCADAKHIMAADGWVSTVHRILTDQPETLPWPTVSRRTASATLLRRPSEQRLAREWCWKCDPTQRRRRGGLGVWRRRRCGSLGGRVGQRRGGQVARLGRRRECWVGWLRRRRGNWLRRRCAGWEGWLRWRSGG
eukprot:scaffold3362_cov121-Isochrysis_galbana.AAC.8